MKNSGASTPDCAAFLRMEAGFNTQEVYVAFPLVLEGLENGNIITSSMFYGSKQSEDPFRFKER